MKELRPYVFVYDIDVAKYKPFSDKYRFEFGNPDFFQSVQTLRYDYIISNRPKIVDAYKKYGIEALNLFESKSAEPVKEETDTNVKVEEDNVTTDATEAPSDDLESLSWQELRKKAQEAGLEGRFNKEEAISFLKDK